MTGRARQATSALSLLNHYAFDVITSDAAYRIGFRLPMVPTSTTPHA
jgi:hypothetical protein